jgi:oligopeptide/dipeptide ABC transporter ATP-binding protein
VTATSGALLEVRGLKTHIRTRQGIVRAVDGVSLRVGVGEAVGLVGESGCGKSMTALSIMRLQPASADILDGEVLLRGQNVLALPASAMRGIRGRHIAMIFQDPMTYLNPTMTAGLQVAEAAVLHRNASKTAARQLALAAIQEAGIPSPARVFGAYPHQLSGGMRQRVLISMAIIGRPALLIADEPTTALDVTIQAQIMELLAKLRAELGHALLMITHDLGLVAEYCDRVYVMYAGQIVEEASVVDLFEDPKHPYTKGLLRSILTADRRVDTFEAIEGNVPALIQPPSGCRFHPRCPAAMARCAIDAPPAFEVGQDRRVSCWLHG